jgi:hypothetical protein
MDNSGLKINNNPETKSANGEGRNILLVVICVCAFLVIVFGIALWFTLPKTGKTTEGNRGEQIITGSLGSEGSIESSQATPEPSFNTIGLAIGQTEESTPLPGITPEPAFSDIFKSEPEKTAVPEDIVLLSIPLSEKKKHIEKHQEKITRSRIEKKVQPTPAPKKQITRSYEYWIQAGSYKSKNLAEIQSAKLSDHGFACQLITKEQSGTMYYRVRIGPYQNKAEADKFLSWVKAIDGMEDSYISQLRSQRGIN